MDQAERQRRTVTLQRSRDVAVAVDRETAQEIAEAYAAGVGQRELEQRFHTSHRKIRHALQLHGVPVRRPGERAVTRVQTAAWLASYQAGVTYADIAAQAGCSQDTVRRRLRDAGVTPRPRPRRWSEDDLDAIVARYLAGQTLTEIASTYGVTEQRLSRVLIEGGRPLVGYRDQRQRPNRKAPERAPRPLARPGRRDPRDRDELIVWVQQAAVALGVASGGRLAAAAYGRWAANSGAPSAAALTRVLGRWSGVVAAAGYLPGQEPRRPYRRLEHADAIRAVRSYLDWASAHPGTEVISSVGYRDWARRHGAPSAALLQRYWHWTDLVLAAANH